MNSNQIFGALSIDVLYGIDTLDHVDPKAPTLHIVDAFARQTKGYADRIAVGRTGALILTTVPGDPNSGAFYLYDRTTRTFYSILFDKQDTFSPFQFDQVILAYELQKLLDTTTPAPAVESAVAVVPSQTVRAISESPKQGNRRNRRNRRFGNRRQRQDDSVRVLHFDAGNKVASKELAGAAA